VSALAPALDGPTCFCRDCLKDCLRERDIAARRCGECGSPRLVFHRALPTLTLAHIDCDAFYATVEKRDNPELADRPVIIGVLYFAHLWRALGDADVQGAGVVPFRDRDPARHGEICQGRPRGA
jgi:hypothetical protein